MRQGQISQQRGEGFKQLIEVKSFSEHYGEKAAYHADLTQGYERVYDEDVDNSIDIYRPANENEKV